MPRKGNSSGTAKNNNNSNNNNKAGGRRRGRPETEEPPFFPSSIYGNYVPEENQLTTYIGESQSAAAAAAIRKNHHQQQRRPRGDKSGASKTSAGAKSARKPFAGSTDTTRPASAGAARNSSRSGGQGRPEFNEFNMPVRTRISTNDSGSSGDHRKGAGTPRSPYPQKLRETVQSGSGNNNDDDSAGARRPTTATTSKYQDPRMLELLLRQVTQRLQNIDEARANDNAATVARVELLHDAVVEQGEGQAARAKAQDEQHAADRAEWTALLEQQRATYSTHHEFFKEVKLESDRWRKADDLVQRLEAVSTATSATQESVLDSLRRMQEERLAMDAAAKQVRADRDDVAAATQRLSDLATRWEQRMAEQTDRETQRDAHLLEQVKTLADNVQVQMDEVLTKTLWRKHVDEVLRNRTIERQQWKKRQEVKQAAKDELRALIESRMAASQWKEHLDQIQRHRVIDAKQRRERQAQRAEVAEKLERKLEQQLGPVRESLAGTAKALGAAETHTAGLGEVRQAIDALQVSTARLASDTTEAVKALREETQAGTVEARQAWTKLADDQQALAGAAIKDELEGLKQSLQQTVVTVQSINNNVKVDLVAKVDAAGEHNAEQLETVLGKINGLQRFLEVLARSVAAGKVGSRPASASVRSESKIQRERERQEEKQQSVAEEEHEEQQKRASEERSRLLAEQQAAARERALHQAKAKKQEQLAENLRAATHAAMTNADVPALQSAVKAATTSPDGLSPDHDAVKDAKALVDQLKAALAASAAADQHERQLREKKAAEAAEAESRLKQKSNTPASPLFAEGARVEVEASDGSFSSASAVQARPASGTAGFVYEIAHDNGTMEAGVAESRLAALDPSVDTHTQAAVRVQALARRKLVEKERTAQDAAAKRLQAHARGSAARTALAKNKEAAAKDAAARRLQAHARGSAARAEIAKQEEAALKLQRVHRGVAARMDVARMDAAALVIQSTYLGTKRNFDVDPWKVGEQCRVLQDESGGGRTAVIQEIFDDPDADESHVKVQYTDGSEEVAPFSLLSAVFRAAEGDAAAEGSVTEAHSGSLNQKQAEARQTEGSNGESWDVLKPVQGLQRTASGRYLKPEGETGAALDRAAVKVQARARGYQARKRRESEKVEIANLSPEARQEIAIKRKKSVAFKKQKFRSRKHTAAAVRVQPVVRGHLSRKKSKQLLEKSSNVEAADAGAEEQTQQRQAELQEQDKRQPREEQEARAAARIQASVRGKQVREELAAQTRAANSIQATARGRAARRKSKELAAIATEEEELAAREAEEQERQRREAAAATKLQAAQRGRQDRARLYQLRKQRQQEQEVTAATRLQAVRRGQRARRKSKELREDTAAVKLQAAHRARRARQRADRLRSEREAAKSAGTPSEGFDDDTVSRGGGGGAGDTFEEDTVTTAASSAKGSSPPAIEKKNPDDDETDSAEGDFDDDAGTLSRKPTEAATGGIRPDEYRLYDDAPFTYSDLVDELGEGANTDKVWEAAPQLRKTERGELITLAEFHADYGRDEGQRLWDACPARLIYDPDAVDLESQSRASVAEGEGADENGDEDDESASQSVEQSTQSPAPGRTSAMPESGDDEEDEEAEDEEDDGFDYEAGAGTGANSDISADHWRVHPDTDEPSQMRDFEQSFGDKARAVWDESEELRYNQDGELSSFEEFVEDYGKAEAPRLWEEAKPK